MAPPGNGVLHENAPQLLFIWGTPVYSLAGLLSQMVRMEELMYSVGRKLPFTISSAPRALLGKKKLGYSHYTYLCMGK